MATADVVYGNTESFRRKKGNPFTKLTSRSFKRNQTTYLKNHHYVHQADGMLHIKNTEKVTILLKCKNVFTVLRERDSAVAVLKNVTFQQSIPYSMMNASKYGAFMEGAGMTLMYAVTLKDWTDGAKIILKKNDTVLILAKMHGTHYVGLTQHMKIGVIPSGVVRLITKPRRFLIEGMMLTMRSLNKHDCEKIFKSPSKLLIWQRRTGSNVPLHIYSTEEGFDPSELESDGHVSSEETAEVFEDLYEIQVKSADRYLEESSKVLEDLVETIPFVETEYQDTSYITNSPRESPAMSTSLPPLPNNNYQSKSEQQDDDDDELYIDPVEHDVSDENIVSDEPTTNVNQKCTDTDSEHWFKGRISREKAEELLTHDGDYLFRFKGDGTNSIVFSYCIGKDSFGHSVVIEDMKEHDKIYQRGTEEIYGRIVTFARTEGLLFQGNKPIRLGGSTRKGSGRYETYDDVFLKPDAPFCKRKTCRDGAYDQTDFSTETEEYECVESPTINRDESGDDGHCYEEADTSMCHSQDPNREEENEANQSLYTNTSQEDRKAMVLQYLRANGHIIVTEDLQTDVADHLIEEKWDELGKLLHIPANTRRRIQSDHEDIRDRTLELFSVWHQRKGQGATVEVLVQALQDLKLEEITLLLEDMKATIEVDE